MMSLHAKFCKFNMHRKGDINLSLFLFSEFCTLEEQEFGRITYMKDVVIYEGFQPNLFHIFRSCILFYMNF
jgi:hypothetical protein